MSYEMTCASCLVLVRFGLGPANTNVSEPTDKAMEAVVDILSGKVVCKG